MLNQEYPFPWKFEIQCYPDAYLMLQVTEDQVQGAILDLCSAYKIDAIAIDAGGRKQRGRMMGAAKKSGVDLSAISTVKTWYSIPAGFADLAGTLAPDGRSLYIEVKAPAWVGSNGHVIRRAGAASPEQLDFLLSKHLRGAIVLVAWSSLDVEDHLRPHLQANLLAVRKTAR
ncbi:MAG: hypothetical protein ACRD4V_07620 [Candidatus Acidiferrales bacterium]